jgi:hypothetical protein
VNAGLIWLPLMPPNITAGIITPNPYPMAMSDHPPPYPLDPLRWTFATVPLPRISRIAVPMNSQASLTPREYDGSMAPPCQSAALPATLSATPSPPRPATLCRYEYVP